MCSSLKVYCGQRLAVQHGRHTEQLEQLLQSIQDVTEEKTKEGMTSEREKYERRIRGTTDNTSPHSKQVPRYSEGRTPGMVRAGDDCCGSQGTTEECSCNAVVTPVVVNGCCYGDMVDDLMPSAVFIDFRSRLDVIENDLL